MTAGLHSSTQRGRIPFVILMFSLPTTKTFVYETLYTIITFLYLQSKYKTSIISEKFIQWQAMGRNYIFFFFFFF